LGTARFACHCVGLIDEGPHQFREFESLKGQFVERKAGEWSSCNGTGCP
jgi:hypothetical protein